MDLRILELQNRLQRKKASNLLLAQAQNQNSLIEQSTVNPSHLLHPNGFNQQQQQGERGLKPRPSTNVYPTQRSLMTGPGGQHHHGNNVAAVEPFIHQPLKQISPPLPLTKSQSQFISTTRNSSTTTTTINLQQLQGKNITSQQTYQQSIIQDHVQTVAQEGNLKKGHVASECDDNKMRQLEEKHQQQTRQAMQTDSLEEDDDGNSSRSSEFSLKKNDPKYQTLPYNTKFNGLATSKSGSNIQLTNHSSSSTTTSSPPAASAIPAISTTTLLPAAGNNHNHRQNQGRTNECDSEKIKETVKQIRQPQSGIKSGIQKPTKLSLSSSSEKLKSPGPIGTMAVPPRKPISSVAPTTVTTTSSATTSSTMIPKIVPKMVRMVAPNNSQTNGSADNSPRPALPPKPSSSVSSSSPQSSDTETLQKGSRGSSLVPPAIVQKSKSANSIPTIVSVINKQSVEKRSLEAMMEENTPAISSSAPEPHLPIKAKPLTIKKQPLHEQPRLKASAGAAAAAGSGIAISSSMKPYLSRRIEMPPSFLFPEIETAELKPPSEEGKTRDSAKDETDKMAVSAASEEVSSNSSLHNKSSSISSMSSASSEKNESKESVARRSRLSNGTQKVKLARRVSFDPLALLLDASLEGELELVRKTATQVPNPSAANDEGITALHNAICAGHLEIVK